MDASVGLTFSLQLFQRYKRSGILQATIRHMPGVQGVCTAYVHLTAGSVTACYLENKHGQRLSYALEELQRVDHDRGPFEWIFQPLQHPTSSSQTSALPSAQPLAKTSSLPPDLGALIPRAVAPLRWDQFNHWTNEQRLLLQYVWKSIDGKRTVQDVKVSLSYPPEMVDEVLEILLTLRIIILAS